MRAAVTPPWGDHSDVSLIAHSANQQGEPQGLRDHLTNVAALADSFAEPFDAGSLAATAGLAHDLGKANPRVQEYLKGQTQARRGPDHSSAGAVEAAKIADVLAFVVAGHHGGLPRRGELKSRLTSKAQDPAVLAVLNSAGDVSALLDDVRYSPVELPGFLSRPSSRTDMLIRAEMFTRMLFSALVDADALDAEAHGSPQKAAARSRPLTIAQLAGLLHADQQALRSARKTPLDDIRNDVYRACVEAAAGPRGFFTLTVPTGGGKTRAALGFAFVHATAHAQSRVVVAIPYTSIIEQTAQVYRQILGDEAVVEHHSAVLPAPGQSAHDDCDPLTLAADNWDAPLVVTTSVQLFESLFSNRPGRCRKLHNLARSVIVLDEVQTLPESLLAPIVSVLNELVANYGCTVLLCTATQPALSTPSLAGGVSVAREIVGEPLGLFQKMRRVAYEMPCKDGSWSWQQVADEMKGADQSLCVVNSRSDAMTLLDALEDPDALHLSTLLCGAHRLAVLNEVRERLRQGRPCRLVSTQVIEAGVDVDFDLVLRALCPLDRIVQAAGRCNREGRLERGRVVVFEPADGHAPGGTYRSATDVARIMLDAVDEAAIDAPDTLREYFSRLYSAADTDRHRIQNARSRLDFPAVDAAFKIIADDGVPVVIAPPAEACALPAAYPTAISLVDRIRYAGSNHAGTLDGAWTTEAPGPRPG